MHGAKQTFFRTFARAYKKVASTFPQNEDIAE